MWTADERPHAAVTRTLQYAVDIASNRNGQHLSAKPFIAGGNTKSKSLSCARGQPWLAQFSQILQRGQSGSWHHANLPPHCPLFALQLLDLTHRWWSESEGPDIEEGDFYSLAAAAHIGIKLHSARYPDPSSFHTSAASPLSHGSCRCSGQAPTSQRATSAHGSGCA